MLNHDEMIENVHRRIAQYEEEKRMKHSRIKKIFSAEKPDTKIEMTNNYEDEYTEIASGTDTVKKSSGMIRMISAVAACAVLAGGIGTTGVLLRKQDKNKPASETDNVVETTTEAAEPEISCPFGDFTARDFTFMNDDGNFGSYSKEAYAKIAEYLNTFNWGENIETNEKQPNTQSPCAIYWDDEIDDRHVIHIYDNGKVFYTVYRMHPDGNEDIFEKGFYKIDYNKFDSEIKAIFAICVYDKNISEQDIANLVEVNLESVKFFDADDNEIVPVNEDIKAKFTEFLSGNFLKMIQPSKPGWDSDKSLLYYVEQIFNVDEKTKRRQTYYIYTNGFINRCEYTTDENGEWQPSDAQNYSINVDELNAKLDEFIKNKQEVKKPESQEEKKEEVKEEPKEEQMAEEQPQATPEGKEQDMSNVDPPKTSPEDLYGISAYATLYDYAFFSPLPHVAIVDGSDNVLALSNDNNIQKFEDFIKNQIEPLKSDTEDVLSDDLGSAYHIFRIYKSDTGKIMRDGYYINGYRNSSIYYYVFENDHWVPYSFDDFYMNSAKYTEVVDEFLKRLK